MASLFSITTPTTNVLLDASRQGEAVFTVSNISGRHVRGRARLYTQNPTAAAWLNIAGTTERDFTIDSTQQISVKVAIPQNAPAGSYVFRLDMVGLENPDEDFTEGPGVTFEVTVLPLPPVKVPWWIIAAAAGVVVVAGVIIAIVVISTSNVIVPDVTLMTVEAAQRWLEHDGLTLGETRQEHSDAVPAGLVIRTDPLTDDKAKRGAAVSLVVSAGSRPTPTPTVTHTPTMTITPTQTYTFTPTLARTPTPTHTKMPVVCPDFALQGPGYSTTNKDLFDKLANSSAADYKKSVETNLSKKNAVAIFFENIGFSGGVLFMTSWDSNTESNPSYRNLATAGWNDKISSLFYFMPEDQLIYLNLYENTNFSGRGTTICGPTMIGNLFELQLNDFFSSLLFQVP